MLIKEVDCKINDFIGGGNLSPKTLVKKRIASLFETNTKQGVFLDKKNVIRPRHKKCINCKSTHVKYNGYHKSESFIMKNIEASIKVGQCECMDCGARWSANVTELYQLLEQLKEEIRAYAVQLKAEKNSLCKTASLLEPISGKRYSDQTINRWYKIGTNNLQEHNICPEECSGYYAYDEQEIRVEGKKMQRLTLRDITMKQPVAEEIKDDKEKKTIREFLVRNLQNKPKVSMVVDGDPSYPDIITKDLRMNYQSDVGHLFGNIKKAFKEECSYGRNPKKLHLADELKKQELYDVFYPRKDLLTFIRKGLAKMAKIHDANMREELDAELQKKLMKMKIERKKKRRRKSFVHEHKNYTVKQAKKKFEAIKMLKNYYPKKLQKVIEKIDKNWEHYILFVVDRNVPPTSNWIEQYYSSTLQRSEKRKFRSLETLETFLKLQRIRQSGVLLDMLSVFGLNFMKIIGLFLQTFLGI